MSDPTSRHMVCSLQYGMAIYTAKMRDTHIYKSCILLVKINSPSNLVRDKGIYSTRAGSILTSAGPAWDLRVQLMEHEGEDQWVQGWELTGRRNGV
jgi:hypothetical protein